MRRLILFRHAKAASAVTGSKDFDRPLTPRGRREALSVASSLQREGPAPDCALVSPAARAKETWASAAAVFPSVKVEYRAALYNAPPKTILEEVRRVCDRFDTLAVVGHNPGLQELAIRLVLEGAGSAGDVRALGAAFPTSTAAVFSSDEAGRFVLEALFHPEREPAEES